MRVLGVSAVTACLVFVSSVSAQAPWDVDQKSTTLCLWQQLRAAVIRDTVYMDGGVISWIATYNNGTTGAVQPDNNPLGTTYTLNFSVAFNTSQNVTALFGTLDKGLGGGDAYNLAPNYFDGAMLANDAEWYLYGGLLEETPAFKPPHSDEVSCYRKYQYGPHKAGFRSGFLRDDLPSDMTRYLAYGGAASAPSENKAWYFSGMHSPSWGEAFNPPGNASTTASNVSDTLITLDMATQQQETWKNVTLPPNIPGRANPELVWVPVGPQGILVALGGVVYPDFLSFEGSTNATASKKQSPGFMSTIDVYDVATGDWYRQATSGSGPGARTRGCAVVASAQDRSSFNVYYYGGYDGLNLAKDQDDDVWVLSLPSFQWIKVADGTPAHGRSGHKCVTPYPDQMMVIGGVGAQAGESAPCLKGGFVQMFNLSSAEWLNGYDPAKWSKYTVPDKVVQKIGGNGRGGATATAPSPSGWQTRGLSKVFATSYPTSKITTYYPYPSSRAGNGTNPDFQGGSSSGSGTPRYLGPVLGTIFGLMFVGLIAVAIIFWRRRRVWRAGGGDRSEAGTEGSRIISWIRGQNYENKAPTVTTEDTPTSPEMERILEHQPVAAPPPAVLSELPNSQVVELPDTSPRVELQDTGLNHGQVIDRHTHFAPGASPPNNPSAYSSNTRGTDYASTVSRSSVARPSPVSPDGVRPDSPSLGHADLFAAPNPASSSTPPPSSSISPSSPPPHHLHPGAAGAAAAAASNPPRTSSPSPSGVEPPPGRTTVESGVSDLSERDRAHLRQVSDASVSSAATGAAGPGLSLGPGPERSISTTSRGGSSPRFRGPAAAGSSGQLRKSVFHEHEEDLGGKGV